jgi:nucleoside 2-deoxyribosyltransferase
MIKVYLAGGMRSAWQNKVREQVDAIFYDPYNKERGAEKIKENLTFEEYTTWDLHSIRMSDVVFVYGERSNPGVGYLIEAGYAKGLGKTVILVLEPDNEHIKDRYLDFVKSVSDIVYTDLDEGILMLKMMAV